MAAYPTLPTSVDSEVTVADGLVADRATNGALKVRSLYTSDKKTFRLIHEISTSQKSTLDTFYGTNKLLNVDYTSPFDGVTYTVRFRRAPQYKATAVHWFATVELEEV